MFNPNLDSDLPWQAVGDASSPIGRFGYLYRVGLNFRADAVLVAVTMANTTRDWKLAGHIIQLWEKDGFSYQTIYKPIRLDSKTIVAIEPLAESILLFNPVDWLVNWRISIRARPYVETAVNNIDNSEVLTQISQLTNTIVDGFESNRTDLGEIAANNVEERLRISTQIQQIDAGIYTLAEGIADLLPDSRGEQIVRTTQNRLNLDLGFL